MKRSANPRAISVLVLTFNRTLRGYIAELAETQLQESDEVHFEISTFSSWASKLLNGPTILDEQQSHKRITELATNIKLDQHHICEEIDYILGKFTKNNLESYLTSRRDGRGTSPRIDRALREQLINEVVIPYEEYKSREKVLDWNDLAHNLINKKISSYDVVVVDETQDFSANEIRAILNQLANEHTVTFVLDTTQRIYSRSAFTWTEVGLVVRPENSSTLSENYRNTQQVARFAAGILDGMQTDADGALPNYQSATRDGLTPMVVRGTYSQQLEFALTFIENQIDLSTESVAFLHPLGGGWFDRLRTSLVRKKLRYAQISRKADWPAGPENIALSTFHSAKGLEFDHVFMIGANSETMPIDDAESPGENESLLRTRRLTAMAIGRARKGVIFGYHPNDPPSVAGFFIPGTFNEVDL